MRNDPAQLSQAREQTRFILVDEFQDANFAQVRVLQMLAGEERNVFAVGDPDQAIYQFRGASSAAFDLFLRHFPGAKLVALEKNRRSTTPVLRCAYTLIAKNPEIFSRGQSPTIPTAARRWFPRAMKMRCEKVRRRRICQLRPCSLLAGTLSPRMR